jgi:dihydroneopterin aldolase
VRAEYAISLNGLRFHARVGVLPHERELPQPIEVDVTVWPGPGEPTSGMLLDYRTLYDLVARVLNEGPIDFLEGVVAAIAERAMDTGNIQRVRVAARKPHVPLPGPLAYAEVALDLTRDE